MRRLASFARVIVFDKRGSGLSDPVGEAATLEERMDDIRAVMDAAGSARADLFGWSEGATIAAVFGASRPDRVSALVLYGPFARGTPAEDYPWAIVPEAWELMLQEDEEESWGQGFSLMNLAPSQFEDEALVRWWGRFERQSMSPWMARAGDCGSIWRSTSATSCRASAFPRSSSIALAICCRSRAGSGSREQMPGARFVELPGRRPLALDLGPGRDR